MPINKNAYIRYQVLDYCFSNFNYEYYFEDLLEKVNEALIDANNAESGIGRTQLFKDIKFMERDDPGFSIPLERHQGTPQNQRGKIKSTERGRRKVYYRYATKDFTIKKSSLSTSESDSIKSAIAVLSRFRGLPQFEWLNEIAPILEDKFDMNNKASSAILFDTNADYQGTEHIQPIYKGINNKQVLDVIYQDFKSPKPYKIVFHPYILKQYNNRWFAFGLNEQRQIYTWNLALDRIQLITKSNKEYVPHQFDWEEDYFYDMIGVSKEKGKPIKIVLQFDAALAPYIATKPIHRTQSKPKPLDSGLVEFTIKVIPNYELERLILSYGEKVRVLSPLTLQKKIAERVRKNMDLYQ